MGYQWLVFVVLLAGLNQYFSPSGFYHRASLPLIFSDASLHDLSVKRHRDQIQALQVQQAGQNDEMANAARLRKAAVGTFYVYLVFWLCCVPQFCIFAVVEISGLNTVVKVFFLFFNYLVISQFLIKLCYLLLEDDTHSTRGLEHTAKYISQSRLKIAFS